MSRQERDNTGRVVTETPVTTPPEPMVTTTTTTTPTAEMRRENVTGPVTWEEMRVAAETGTYDV